MRDPLRRRVLLAGLSTGVASALAGCSALGDDDTSKPEPYRIGGISLLNDDSTSHTVDLLVERDREIVHWEAYDLAERSGDGASADAVESSSFGGCTPGRYSVAVRVDDTATRVLEAADEGARRENAWRTLLIEDGGTLRWAVTVLSDDEENCPTTTQQG
ncbi:hypothetical protein [Halomarina oriensis]|uniref:Lipoprotein n=1 Tax=Halomarina oriensis TaxID=671145 RepID=A0A6B0GPQ1_9EURY|nr:hypothetical protein [Halomarina oriensis]MWG36846.1 hypothetical protein [Halomarina oriensis]